MKKNILFLAVFFINTLIFSQEILNNSEDKYFDFLSLSGIVEKPTLTYKTLSDSVYIPQTDVNHPWKDTKFDSDITLFDFDTIGSNWFLDGLEKKISLRIYSPQNYSSYNTAAPFGQNEGGLWQGRGFNTAFTTGIRAEGFGFELTFRPQISFSQNKEYDYLVSGYTSAEYKSKARKYGYVWGACDAPQRFGETSFWNYDWGDSEIRWSWHTFTLGFGTQSIWLGPATQNPVLHSNNAASYPKFDVGLRKTAVIIPKLNWNLGYIEGRIWLGKLEESDYFDNIENNNYRQITGFTASYSPSFMKGFTLGINKICICSWENANRLQYLNPLFRGNTLTTKDSRGEDQKLSINADWLFEKVQFQVYTEIGIDDFLPNGLKFYEYARYPFHTLTYTVGFKKGFNMSKDGHIKGLLEFEWNNTETSMDYQLWPKSGYNFAFHYQLKQGYTNRGQWLGSGIGYGGNSQYLAYTIYSPHGFEKIFVARNNPDNNFIWAKTVDKTAEQVRNQWFEAFKANFYTGFETETIIFNSLKVSTGFIYNLIINPMYNPGYSKEDGIYNVYTYEHNFVFRAGVKYSI